MTLSIELLPAPFGPMMARISCSRTSKETSVSAFTPPNESDTFSTARITSPTGCAFCVIGGSGGFLRRGPAEGARVADREVGRDHAAAPVLVLDLHLDVRALAAVVERGHQRAVLLGDRAAPHLAGARQLAIVGVELLVQDEEAMDLRAGELGLLREIRVHLLDAFADQVDDLRARSEVGIAGIRQVALLGPVADRFHVEIDEGADPVAAVAKHHRLLDVREELELVLQVFRREQRAVGELADILHAIDDLE